MSFWSVIELIKKKKKNSKNVILYVSCLQPPSIPLFNANVTYSHFKLKKPYVYRLKPAVIKPKAAFECGLLKNGKSGKEGDRIKLELVMHVRHIYPKHATKFNCTVNSAALSNEIPQGLFMRSSQRICVSS
jgi:hypothetical protein